MTDKPFAESPNITHQHKGSSTCTDTISRHANMKVHFKSDWQHSHILSRNEETCSNLHGFPFPLRSSQHGPREEITRNKIAGCRNKEVAKPFILPLNWIFPLSQKSSVKLKSSLQWIDIPQKCDIGRRQLLGIFSQRLSLLEDYPTFKHFNSVTSNHQNRSPSQTTTQLHM